METSPKNACRETGKILAAYFDGELPPREAGLCAEHLRSCPRCRQAGRQYREISRALVELAGEGGEVSLWPEIRQQLERESSAGQPSRTGKRYFTILRPAWVGLGLSAAAALIILFSGVLTGRQLPENYCRIESISAPEHNLMIHRGQSDGLTIIWLTE